jgi:hypothetical protein
MKGFAMRKMKGAEANEEFRYAKNEGCGFAANKGSRSAGNE